MTILHLASWNINGLNAPVKRSMCLDWLKRHGIDVAFIQEPHFRHSDKQCLSNRFYYTPAAATFNSRSRGALVVLRRALSLTILGSYESEDGRLAYIKTNISGQKIAFLCIYATNHFSSEFFGSVSKTLYDLQDFSIIIGADMNAVLDPLLDRSGVPPQHTLPSTVAFQGLVDDFTLTDLFRAVNPSSRQYSFYSCRHRTYSRIDHLLASAVVFSEIHTAEIHPNSLSDHCVVTAQLTLARSPIKATRWRFNTTLLKNNDYCDYFRNALKTFISENANSVEDPRILWSAIKGFVRNATISFASHLNRTRLGEINRLENELQRLEHVQQSDATEDNKKKIHTVRTKLHNILRLRAEFQIHRTRRNYYFNGSRPSHLLSLSLQKCEKYSNITAISSNQNLLTAPKEINSAFQTFYSELYKSEVSLDKSECDSFFQDLELPTLTHEDAQCLGEPITITELRDAVAGMKRGKSPGWDGIPPEFYFTFWEEMGQYLLAMFHKAIEVGAFFNDINAALIAVLPKPNKDTTQCGNYRPLSILNAEIKIFARILASRLEPHLTTLIKNDQTGFVKSRLASDNVRRLLHVIYAAQDIPSPCAVLSLDAEKAFDRLEWDYLWVVLQRFNLGTTFINFTKLLYSNPSAMISTNGVISNKFPLSRSCRQGCPLSPFLFILSLEPLAQKIRQHPAISPITFNNTTHAISLYADDILLFFDRASNSLPHILDTFEVFSSLSGYKINWTKSALLPLNSKLDPKSLPQHIPVVKQFKYLGIDIFPSVTTIVNKNFHGIFSRIETDLTRWSHLPKSFQARVSIIKMDILPRINFFSSMLPLSPPTDYWKKVHSLISKFIWAGKRPRVKLSTLQRHKLEGGFSVPDFKFYFWSFVLRPLTDWLTPDSDPCWKPIEKNLVLPHRLEDLIYSAVPLKRSKLRFGPIVNFLLSTWCTVEKESKNSCKWHSNSPLFNNYSLLTGGGTLFIPRLEFSWYTCSLRCM